MGRIEDHHAEWLSLVEASGPFLTVPTLKRVLPDGLGALPPQSEDLRVSYEEWRADHSLHARWVGWVLEELLGLGHAISNGSDAGPVYRFAERGVTLRPSLVVRDAASEGEPAVLLVHRHDAGTALDRPLPGEAWAASPIDRAVELARASGVPLALVTNGQLWTLVWARTGETTGTCTWRSELWLEEPITLRAFVELLGARRFFSLPLEQGLAVLLADSAGKQQEVADQLGAQVRRATELLITTLDREDRDRHGELLEQLESERVYQGATTVMMRLVFLFVAEERRLLPIDDELYAATLAASTLRGQLRERADRDGEEVLERSHAAWHRVLALFRAVHGGIEHDALRLPAYGGGLFDPDRYPFLEGRRPGTTWRSEVASPLPVDDRTMLHLLDQLQTLEQGATRVLLSYQALDVEQIGHVYEGLLDHTAVRITDTGLGLAGKLEPELALGEVERWAAEGNEVLVQRLAKATGRSSKAIAKALATEPDEEVLARLRAACLNHDALLARVRPYHSLLRLDLRGDPLVFPAGSLYVTQAIERRATGTYYTPRQLAEEVVQHALNPIAYDPGPAHVADPDAWRLRPAHELLDLKIADIAMGSGAFLVASCRYLATRLLQAWAQLGPGEWTVFGRPRSQAVEEAALPADPQLREQLAHRLVTERCLYGVDKNPMAVEMAKLSLWLITLAKDQPFSFVDHALRAGDSLLGVADLRQLRVANLDPDRRRQASLDLGFHEIEQAVERSLRLRDELEGFVVLDVSDAERKAAMLARADAALEDARLLADLVVGAALSQQPDADPLQTPEVASNVRVMLDPQAPDDDRLVARSELRRQANDWLVERRGAVGEVEAVEWADRHPFHWALEFPEVRRRGGFDAIVGNPPFQGGKKISGALGGQYRDYLVTWLARGRRGNADLVAYFYLHATELLRANGCLGLIATNTIAQGDTRDVGLDQILTRGWLFYRALASEPWPGGANLQMSTVWAWRARWAGSVLLDHRQVDGITSTLESESRVSGPAYALASNKGYAHQGSIVLGDSFFLDESEAQTLLREDRANEAVVKRCLNAAALNDLPDQTPDRWVLDFTGLEEAQAARFEKPWALARERALPDRENRNPHTYRGLLARWWQYWNPREELYRQASRLPYVLIGPRHSKWWSVTPMRTGWVYTEALVVFPLADYAHAAVLSSTFHDGWARKYSGSLKGDLRYSPTDCFENFPFPTHLKVVEEIGRLYIEHRKQTMLAANQGLTALYNRVHEMPDDTDPAIMKLRCLRAELDRTVARAYAWHDLELDHGFRETTSGMRYTISQSIRVEAQDRLLAINHERYAQEVAQGLHDKKKTKRRPRAAAAGALTLDLGDV